VVLAKDEWSSKLAKRLFAIIFKPEIMVIDCKDVTDEYEVNKNERIFRVKYVKFPRKGKPIRYIRYIRFTGEYSENPEIALLQKYCVERVKHVRENTS
jgi:hypothetical protein